MTATHESSAFGPTTQDLVDSYASEARVDAVEREPQRDPRVEPVAPSWTAAGCRCDDHGWNVVR